MVNHSADRVIPHNLDMLVSTYHRRLRGLQRRHKHGKSVRALAAGLRISHPTLLSIFKDPGREVSRKVMVKIIQRTSTRLRAKPRFAVTTGLYAPDAI
jgi:hypothetical protein